MQRSSANATIVGLGPVAIGAAAAILNMDVWFTQQESMLSQTQRLELSALGFFAVQGLAAVLILYGIFSLLRRLRTSDSPDQPTTTRSVLADAISTPTGMKIVVLASVVYAVFYLFASSVIVYQPSVDFASTYGVTQPGWNAVACCGNSGTVPALIVYLSSPLHLGMQLIPLDLLLATTIPVLVGVNASVGLYALRNRPTRPGTRWFGALGAFAALFTACPTCAGFFLASTLGGFGATTLALGLAPFQALFIAMAIPILIIAPVLTARSIRVFMSASCRVAR